MPHCIIEYSAPLHAVLKPSQLISAVYNGAFNSELFENSEIKTRVIPFDNYQSGSVKVNFIHVVTKILSGRTLAQRKLLSQTILAELKMLNLSKTSLTVEIVEMERDSYAKVIT
ncbi:5-carboxymethyl-2-hydroxymuconate Delta-isomerase [Colwellia sp. D2M02]|uniref:5-carboxymethyl-2-hydroxymuconate isomerase n=1 Tax=Colwellia asteriadis TaxID=517723 RepID=A0ABN1L7B2_9GAMM|nr:5-carboxymethyl-2-hydroxymuconate Delta-isomerase [Colwellia sp. D2M02]MBU2892312.1 5-carboxymethyl-2-hydroxymuconate Delta-isomerase [Colwellia sp. D2M02]